jgi:hypothetical protein
MVDAIGRYNLVTFRREVLLRLGMSMSSGSDLALFAAMMFGCLFCFLIFRKPKVSQAKPISAIARFGFSCVCIAFIVDGLFNLFCGFRYGEMYWVSKYGGHDGWMPYEGYKRAFMYLGFLSTFGIIFGIFMIRKFARDGRSE